MVWALLFLLAFPMFAWPAYRSFREKRPLEGIGHLLVWILLASVAFASTMAAPRHVIDVLVGLSFAVWAPVTWVSLKRKMR